MKMCTPQTCANYHEAEPMIPSSLKCSLELLSGELRLCGHRVPQSYSALYLLLKTAFTAHTLLSEQPIQAPLDC